LGHMFFFSVQGSRYGGKGGRGVWGKMVDLVREKKREW